MMKAFTTRYLNDIVSLTVLLLMAVAFVGAQAHAVAEPTPVELADEVAMKLEAMIESSDIRANVSVDLESLEIKFKLKD